MKKKPLSTIVVWAKHADSLDREIDDFRQRNPDGFIALEQYKTFHRVTMTTHRDVRHAITMQLKQLSEVVTVSGNMPKRFEMLPGSRMRAWLQFIWSKKTFENVFAQAIRDMQDEYVEAVAAGSERRAAYVAWRGRVSVLWAIADHLSHYPLTLLRHVFRSAPPS